MKRQFIFCLLPALAVLLWGCPVWAAEQPPAPAAQPAPVIGQQGIVLGQPDAQRPPAVASPTAPAVPPAQAAPPAVTATTTSVPSQADTKKPDVQSLFEESLRQMMPLDDSQIQEYRERSDQRERALLPVSPALASRTARVSLEPGASPVRVYTTANIATSLLIHEALHDIRVCIDPEFTGREWQARIPGDPLPLRLPDPDAAPPAMNFGLQDYEAVKERVANYIKTAYSTRRGISDTTAYPAVTDENRTLSEVGNWIRATLNNLVSANILPIAVEKLSSNDPIMAVSNVGDYLIGSAWGLAAALGGLDVAHDGRFS